MNREHKRKCKQTGCGEWFIVSAPSMASDKLLGYAEPEYCPRHRAMHAKSYSRIAVHHIDITETEAGSELIRRAEEAKAQGVKLSLGPGGIGQFNREIRPFLPSANPEPVVRDFPIARCDEELLAALDAHQVVILVGPTGSGKSTYVPFMLLRSQWSRRGPIVVTQPRIQATTQIPRFVARLNNSSWGPGAEIGYVHSKDEKFDRRTRLLFMTDGKLLNDIVSGKISNYSIIMIDEAHERSVNIDLILGLLREQLYLYPHLRLIIASATIDHGTFRSYFGRQEPGGKQEPAPLIESEGRFFGYDKHFWNNDTGVDEHGKPEETDPGWWQEVNSGSLPERDELPTALADLVAYLCKKLDKLSPKEKEQRDGHILIFLPGKREIDQTVSEIIARRLPNVLTLPLYAQRPMDEQDRALDPKNPRDRSMRRVVVSTNVAETSLTVEGIKYVIDTGYIKESYWNPTTEIAELMTVRHSKAGCRQRWGRAGRLSAGDVYMLYTKEQFQDLFPDYTSPEVARSSLEQVILTALAAGVRDITKFAWMPLSRDSDQARLNEELKRALQSLKRRKAVDDDNDLTQFGMELRGMPVDMEIATIFAEGDRHALGVEVATLLPFLKLDRGLQNVFSWDTDGDSYEEHAIRKRHLDLVYGCLDDLDLYLKLWMLWEHVGTNGQQRWCDDNGLDYATFKSTIEDERKKLLGSIMDWRKAEQRQIVVEKIDALRLLIASCLPRSLYEPVPDTSKELRDAGYQDFESYWEGGDSYQEYDDEFDLDPSYALGSAGTSIFQRAELQDGIANEEDLVEIAPISLCYSQSKIELFVACQRKANYLRPARAKSLALNLIRLDPAWLKLLAVQSWQPLLKLARESRVDRMLMFATLSRWRNEEDHLRTRVRLFLPWLAPVGTLITGTIMHYSPGSGVRLSLSIKPAEQSLLGPHAPIEQIALLGQLDTSELGSQNELSLQAGQEISAHIIGYDQTSAQEPLLLLSQRELNGQQFSRFATRYRKGMTVLVQMRQILRDPLGKNPVFVVREPTTGLDIPMSAADFCGGTHFHAYFGLRFAEGQEFNVEIHAIDSQLQCVYLSRLRFLLNEYQQVSRDLNQRITDARVVSIDPQGIYLAVGSLATPYVSFVRRALWPAGLNPREGEMIPARLRFYDQRIDIEELREQLKNEQDLPSELNLGIELDLRIPPAYQRFKQLYQERPRGKLLIEPASLERILDSGGLLLDMGHGLRAFVHADELSLDEHGHLRNARTYKLGDGITARITKVDDEKARIECSLFRIPKPPDLPRDVPMTVRVLMVRTDRRNPERRYITCSLDNTYRVSMRIDDPARPITVGELLDVYIVNVDYETADIRAKLADDSEGGL